MHSSQHIPCPKCILDVNTKIKSIKEELAKSYGKVPKKKYESISTSLTSYTCISIRLRQNPTLRQDWEVSMKPDGTLSLEYGCYCTKCKWEYLFNKEENVL